MSGKKNILGPLAFLLVALVILAAPSLGISPAWSRQFVFLAIAVLVVTGLNLSLGYAGEMALGQSVLVAAGAYTVAILAIRHPELDLSILLFLGGLAGAATGALIGIPGLRLGSWSLAIVTFLTVIILPDIILIFQDTTGGLLGLPGIPFPPVFGLPLDQDRLYVVVMGVSLVWFVLYRNLVLSRWAVILLTLKTDPIAASSLGISRYRTKLLVYVLSSIPAGIAGGLLAIHTAFIGPELFHLERSIAFLAGLVLGGAGSIYGPLVGTAIVELGPFQTGVFRDYALVAFGLLLLTGSVLIPGGVAAAARQILKIRPLALRRYEVRAGDLKEWRAPEVAEDEPARLEVKDISVQFGAAVVLEHITFDLRSGVNGLIGPNGSGKTTLLNAISGFLPGASGSVSLDGALLSDMAPFQRSRAGVARTFQAPRLPVDTLVVEAVAVGASKGRAEILPAMLRLPSWRRREAEELGQAHAALRTVGIEHIATMRVAEISAGHQRLVEIARALLTRPRLLLLDEPAAGLTEGETEQLRHVLNILQDSGMIVVLIDHNLSFVSTACSRVMVLDAGRMIFDGKPEDAVVDAGVKEAYIGV